MARSCRASAKRQGAARGPRRPRGRGADLYRDAARRRRPYDHRDRGRPRLQGQYRALRRAAEQLFHDGRQSRQFDRFAASRRTRAASAMCRSRIWSAAPRSSSSRCRRTNMLWPSGAGRGRCDGTGCSSRRIDARRKRRDGIVSAARTSPRSRRASATASSIVACSSMR